MICGLRTQAPHSVQSQAPSQAAVPAQARQRHSDFKGLPVPRPVGRAAQAVKQMRACSGARSTNSA